MQTNITRRKALTGVAALASIVAGAFHPRAAKAGDYKLESLWLQWMETREAALEASENADSIEGEMKLAASRKLPPSNLEVPDEYEWYRDRPAYLFDAATDPDGPFYQGETLRAFREAQAKELREEGGGPQLDLLRRLAHWMMKEPELEEEALWAEPVGQTMRIVRRSLSSEVGAVTVTRPDGGTDEVMLEEVSPGRFEALYDGPEIGLYRLAEGEQEAVVGLGPAAPREFEETIASGDPLAPMLAATGGGVSRLEAGIPQIREVRAGRPAIGRGWIGITPREAFETLDVRQTPLLPAWLVLLLAAGLIVGAWLREGRA